MGTEEHGGKKTVGTSQVAPATGKLGVMVVGLGAVATTFIAGVEAVRRGLAKPIGSLTQMGTIRLGKRTDNKSPLIKDFVPLADLNDLVFTGWDIFEDNVYESAAHAKVQNFIPPRTFGGVPLPCILTDSMQPHYAHSVCPFVVGGCDHSPFARCDVLGGIKREAGHVAKHPHHPSPVARR